MAKVKYLHGKDNFDYSCMLFVEELSSIISCLKFHIEDLKEYKKNYDSEEMKEFQDKEIARLERLVEELDNH